MKAAFRAEAIGFRPDVARLLRRLGVGDQMPWVAEITGTDPRYGYARTFVKHKADFRDSNSKGTRGVWFWWTLESGRVYQVKYRESWGGWLARFLRVTDGGDIEDLTEEEVTAWLSRDSGSTS